MESARPARVADLDDLVRLWDHAVAELDGQRGGALLAGTLHLPDPGLLLGAALSDPDRLLALGFIDRSAVGVTSCRLDRLRREPLGVLDVIFVEPTARQVGVAEAMLDVAADWCRSVGAVGIDGPALPGNRPAKSFFETHGFQARLLVMHRPFAPPAGG